MAKSDKIAIDVRNAVKRYGDFTAHRALAPDFGWMCCQHRSNIAVTKELSQLAI